ncbi:hypothetical protein [Sphingomicrobium astaxanthinifaciens]|uniref:hypothetical protein n=1 Tax=Sphingomicrobium astaxanthinifaciens TaxID=1227949 RepID=UPI001FCB42BD|nr:hypothetical protein [Sphingomicrobium astaxanthinifaciens]MCJ7421805.1 hypothetical protein [Sphingomicrobium astaxanthinifaciens]
MTNDSQTPQPSYGRPIGQGQQPQPERSSDRQPPTAASGATGAADAARDEEE